MSLIKYDENIARSVHDQLNCFGVTENAVIPKEKGEKNYRPRTLVDETLEYIDPTPNIHTLFVQFNEKFFWNVLLPVQVKWSPRMTSCAGVCTFHPRNRECVISLSNPLLKLRPRKDLIETLLHEMIHAYLFLTNDNRDRDGHGPIFQSHMKRINREAGTNITIYHNFHDEVRLYQQHWWRCNGPCQKRAPYFGTVRRAMNRAPGPYDFWWNEHQVTCGGQFIKIKEPEKPEPRRKQNNVKNVASISTVAKLPEKSNILNWIKKVNNSDKKSDQENIPNKTNNSQINKWNNIKDSNTKPCDKTKFVTNIQTDLKKLGNSTNSVHGWGTGGPNSHANISSNNTNFNNRNSSNESSNKKTPRLSFSGTVGGTGTGRSNLLDKFTNTASNIIKQTQPFSNQNDLLKTTTNTSSTNNLLIDMVIPTVNCPNCDKTVEETKINEHLDLCLQNTETSNTILSKSNKKRKNENDYSTTNKIFKDDRSSISKDIGCPLCAKKVLPENFNEHLNNCLQNDFSEKEDDVISSFDSSSSSVNLHDSPHVCLICDKALDPNESLNNHLEDCVASVFDDSHNNSNDIIIVEQEKMTDKEKNFDNFPCPVCMKLIKSSLMNEHLDICLTKTK